MRRKLDIVAVFVDHILTLRMHFIATCVAIRRMLLLYWRLIIARCVQVGKCRSVLGMLNRKRQGSRVGIDISSTTIKLLELSESDSGYRVEAYSVASLPQGAVFEKNINNVGEVATAIQSVMHQSRSRATEVVAAVSGSSVINKTIAMPAGLTDEEMETQIALEADQYIPYPLEEVALDFEVQGPTPGRDDQVDVLLAACRRETIDLRVEALELAGLTPKVIDVEAYSMERAYELIRPVAGVDPAATVAVVDIGATMTTLSVINQGANAYTREQNFGGKQLTDEIMRRYGLPLREAGLAKKQGGLPDGYEEEVLTPFKEAVIQQVGRSLQFFYSSSSFNAVDHIFLAGGVAATDGLVSLVGSRLATPTTIANPFHNMSISPRVTAVALSGDAPAMMVAAGLALRAMG